MSSSEYDKYFEMLELSPDASLSEVKQAYSRLIKLYSGDSIAVNPLAIEFDDSRRLQIIRDIEKAYEKLAGMFYVSNNDEGELEDEISGPLDVDFYDGDSLRRIREKQRLDLRDVELTTKIGKVYLENIEMEKFSALPEAVYVQGYVKAYARCLSLDPQRVTGDYMKKFNEWKNGKE
jgi:hypothetical protein